MRCLKKHTQKSPHFISFRGWFIRATSCTLRGNRELRTEVVIHSCIKMHVTRESWITYQGWIIRATSCTLLGNRESRTAVESFVQQVARYEGIVNHVSGLNHSCIVACNLLHEIGNAGKELNNVPCVVWSWIGMHVTRESRITYRGWIIRASRCTLRGNRESRIEVESFVQQVARYGEIVNHVSGLIIRATSCTLHSKWIMLLMVDNMLFEKTHEKITALYFVPWLIRSCNKLHATGHCITHYRYE